MDTLLDLVQPADEQQSTEAMSAGDDESNPGSYLFTKPGAELHRPELVLSFVPGGRG